MHAIAEQVLALRQLFAELPVPQRDASVVVVPPLYGNVSRPMSTLS